MFINLHRHTAVTEKEWAIQNLNNDLVSVSPVGNYSAGLHPWYLNENDWSDEMEKIKKISLQKYILAIGECGLDRVCKTNFNLQKRVFSAQLIWANEINKPLIIHCVKAYEDVLMLLEKYAIKVPVIFHGFNKKIQIAQKITNAGYYLSFGKAILLPAMKEVVLQTPDNQFFLETDDEAIDIEQVYNMAASIKNISQETLIFQMNKNVQTVFNISI